MLVQGQVEMVSMGQRWHQRVWRGDGNKRINVQIGDPFTVKLIDWRPA